jgi:hypothetical protein
MSTRSLSSTGSASSQSVTGQEDKLGAQSRRSARDVGFVPIKTKAVPIWEFVR